MNGLGLFLILVFKGFVRAQVICNATLFEHVPGQRDQCVFTLAGETDLKANVPKSFIKMFAPKKAAEVATFGKMARERAKTATSTLQPLIDKCSHVNSVP